GGGGRLRGYRRRKDLRVRPASGSVPVDREDALLIDRLSRRGRWNAARWSRRPAARRRSRARRVQALSPPTEGHEEKRERYEREQRDVRCERRRPFDAPDAGCGPVSERRSDRAYCSLEPMFVVDARSGRRRQSGKRRIGATGWRRVGLIEVPAGVDPLPRRTEANEDQVDARGRRELVGDCRRVERLALAVREHDDNAAPS